MRVTVNDSLHFMRDHPEIKMILLEGVSKAKPYKKSGNRKPSIAHNTEQDQAFKKVWYSKTGDCIRDILRENLGASWGVKDAARIYFAELREDENAGKRY